MYPTIHHCLTVGTFIVIKNQLLQIYYLDFNLLNTDHKVKPFS